MLTHRGARLSDGQRTHDLADDVVGLLAHFVICCVLNRVCDKYALSVGHAQRVRLRRGCSDELRRSDGNRRRPLNFKPYRVMQTARSTGTSVSQRLDDKVIIALNFLAQCRRGRLRECRLFIPSQRHSG